MRLVLVLVLAALYANSAHFEIWSTRMRVNMVIGLYVLNEIIKYSAHSFLCFNFSFHNFFSYQTIEEANAMKVALCSPLIELSVGKWFVCGKITNHAVLLSSRWIFKSQSGSNTWQSQSIRNGQMAKWPNYNFSKIEKNSFDASLTNCRNEFFDLRDENKTNKLKEPSHLC